jgi:hypothetical protein
MTRGQGLARAAHKFFGRTGLFRLNIAPVSDKMRRIMESHVEEAETADGREAAAEALKNSMRPARSRQLHLVNPQAFVPRCPCKCEEHGPRVARA